MHPHRYINTLKLSPPTLCTSQCLSSNKSSSVHRWWGFGGFATPPYVHSHSDNSAPMSFEEVATYPPLCAVNQYFGLSSVHATQTTPKRSLSFCAKSKGRALQGHTSSCASGKRTSVPAPQLPRVLPFPTWEQFSWLPLTLGISSTLQCIFCCFTTTGTYLYTIHCDLNTKQ